MKKLRMRLLSSFREQKVACLKVRCGMRALLLLFLLPWVTQCSFIADWAPGGAPREPLTLQNVRLETPPAIAPEFNLSTPDAIAPEIEVALLPADGGDSAEASPTTGITTQSTSSNSPTASSTVTVTTTTTATATTTNSPTASYTPVTIWPTWTTAPTSTYMPSPTPTKTSPPATQPPPTPSATPIPTNTTEPGSDPPPDPSPTYTPTVTYTPQPTDTPNPSSCNPTGNSSYEATLIGLINDARQAQGLHPLVAQSQLTAAARVHSNDMACNDFISHTGSDGSSPADRVTAQGYSYSWVGENIFAGSSSPQTAFDWWMNSEPHRNNILHSNYTEIGIGYSYLEGSRYRSHYTAVFARPR